MVDLTEYGDFMPFGSPAILDEYGSRRIDGLLEDGRKIISVGIILKEVADSFGLADSLLANKSLAVSDSIGVSDQPLKNWTPTVADSFGITDSISLSKLMEIADSLGLTDSILRDKSLSVSDSFGLADAILLNKILSLADSFGLSELVEKIVAGVTLKEVVDSLGLSDSVKVYLGTFYDKPKLLLALGGLVIPISWKKEKVER